MRALNIKPDRTWRIALAVLPFLFLLLAYLMGSASRLAENPNDKLLPSFVTMGQAVKAYALEPDARTGVHLMWSDTTASLGRLLTALAISTVIALVFGILIGLLPVAGAAFARIQLAQWQHPFGDEVFDATSQRKASPHFQLTPFFLTVK